MKTKLTLRMDEELIARAKAHARMQQTSVSQLIADYIRLLDAKTEIPADVDRLPPILEELHGCLRDSGVDERDYQTYLAEKHG